jgi:hypothetical protein
MLFLLSPLHHLHSIYNNHLFSLVVQVDFILNSCLLVCPNPIVELQHALLLHKCCELKNMPQFIFIFFVVSFWDPLLGLLRSLGVHQTFSTQWELCNSLKLKLTSIIIQASFVFQSRKRHQIVILFCIKQINQIYDLS